MVVSLSVFSWLCVPVFDCSVVPQGRSSVAITVQCGGMFWVVLYVVLRVLQFVAVSHPGELAVHEVVDGVLPVGLVCPSACLGLFEVVVVASWRSMQVRWHVLVQMSSA